MKNNNLNEYTSENVWERMVAERLTIKDRLVDEIIAHQPKPESFKCDWSLTPDEVEYFAISLLYSIVTIDSPNSIDNIKQHIEYLMEDKVRFFSHMGIVAGGMDAADENTIDELLGYKPKYSAEDECNDDWWSLV